MGRLGDLRTRGAKSGVRALGRATHGYYVNLDYPTTVENAPRYGHGRPAHRGLERLIRGHEASYAPVVRGIARYADELARIEVDAADPRQPSWANKMISGLDGAAAYAFMREREPAHYVEIGSGNSTKFAARAKADGALATELTSIDPDPRAEIDQLCDVVVRESLEAVDLAVFERVGRGDVVYFDGSHRTFMNSDVAVFFLDVLPALPAGVLVGIHDIYLPDDYPAAIAERYYSEQYPLATWLLGGADVEILLPTWLVSNDPELAGSLDELWERPGLGEVDRHGVSFWFETR